MIKRTSEPQAYLNWRHEYILHESDLPEFQAAEFEGDPASPMVKIAFVGADLSLFEKNVRQGAGYRDPGGNWHFAPVSYSSELPRFAIEKDIFAAAQFRIGEQAVGFAMCSFEDDEVIPVSTEALAEFANERVARACKLQVPIF